MTKQELEVIKEAIEAAILATLDDLRGRFGEKSPLPTLPFSKEEKLHDGLIYASRAGGAAAAETLKKICVTG